MLTNDLLPWPQPEFPADAVVLVLANKQDLPGAMTAAEMTQALALASLRSRDWYIQSTCATAGQGIYEGEWNFLVQSWGAAVRVHAGVICDVDGWLRSAEPWCVGPKGLGKQPPECLEARCSLVARMEAFCWLLLGKKRLLGAWEGFDACSCGRLCVSRALADGPPLPPHPAYTGLDWVSENIAKS